MPLTHLENRAGVFVLAGVGLSRGSSRSDFKNRGLRETLGWTPPFDDLQCPTRTYGAAAPRGAGR